METKEYYHNVYGDFRDMLKNWNNLDKNTRGEIDKYLNFDDKSIVAEVVNIKALRDNSVEKTLPLLSKEDISRKKKQHYKDLFFPKLKEGSKYHKKLDELTYDGKSIRDINLESGELNEFMRNFMDESTKYKWNVLFFDIFTDTDRNLTFYKSNYYNIKDKKKDKLCLVKVYLDKFETDENEADNKFNKMEFHCITIGDPLYGIPFNILLRVQITKIDLDNVLKVLKKEGNVIPMFAIVCRMQESDTIECITPMISSKKDVNILTGETQIHDTLVGIKKYSIKNFLHFFYLNSTVMNDVKNGTINSKTKLLKKIREIKNNHKTYKKNNDAYNREYFVQSDILHTSDHYKYIIQQRFIKYLNKIGAQEFIQSNFMNDYFVENNLKYKKHVFLTDDIHTIPDRIFEQIFTKGSDLSSLVIESYKNTKQESYYGYKNGEYDASFLLYDMMKQNSQILFGVENQSNNLFYQIPHLNPENSHILNEYCYNYFMKAMRSKFDTLKKMQEKYLEILSYEHLIPYVLMPLIDINDGDKIKGFVIIVNIKFIVLQDKNLETYIEQTNDKQHHNIVVFIKDPIHNYYYIHMGKKQVKITKNITAENIFMMTHYIIKKRHDLQHIYDTYKNKKLNLKNYNATVEKKKRDDEINDLLAELYDAKSYDKTSKLSEQTTSQKKEVPSSDEEEESSSEEKSSSEGESSSEEVKQPTKFFKSGKLSFDQSFSQLDI
jgi:hypothetical protein